MTHLLLPLGSADCLHSQFTKRRKSSDMNSLEFSLPLPTSARILVTSWHPAGHSFLLLPYPILTPIPSSIFGFLRPPLLPRVFSSSGWDTCTSVYCPQAEGSGRLPQIHTRFLITSIQYSSWLTIITQWKFTPWTREWPSQNHTVHSI